jgi:hypothetical protein
MAATYMLDAGKILPAGTEVNVDWRLAELLEWQREEGRRLPLFADIIIWLENHGYVVDLITGEVSQLEPLQSYIDYQAELAELRDAMAEEEWIRRGCQ